MVSNLLFNSVDIGAKVPLFRLIDVQVGGAGREINTLSPALADGDYFAGARNTPREIVVTFCLPDDSEQLAPRIQALRQINALLASKTPCELRSSMLGDGYFNAICTELPAVSRLGWTEELTAKFVAHDPYFYSDFDDLNLILSDGGTTTNIYINCSGSVRPTITQVITSALTDPMWICNNDQGIALVGTVAAGTLEINCETREITHSADADIMTKLSLDSTFFDFSPNPDADANPYDITCTNGAAGTLAGKYRWL